MSDNIAGTLWTSPGQFTGRVVRAPYHLSLSITKHPQIKATAAFGGIKLKFPSDYVHYEDNYKEEFKVKFPHSKIPAWEGNDGFLLFESAAIARYVAGISPESGLLGKNIQEAALVDQWVHLIEEVNDNTENIDQILDGTLAPYSKSIHAYFVSQQFRGLTTLNAHLATRTFLVGERITLADIYVAALTLRACGINVDTAARKKIPHLMRHLETLIHQPIFEGIFFPVPVLEKAPVYVAPKKNQ
ncbi:Glutathione S-transferase C-terminal-like protein [Mycena indigotica]|uniref:Glutathione S-transferase C-terminal-like protein n=1 Tax=Mycena indigotica TaxID=2126181 RepID=A0A8H6T6P8_9AGAR|nr:Glutathione S-transferase C-terminal-like protein [Mycena indigotica]KAF7311946.1 Glutathione S-transferase C-terminal-like protein [Mycena indigotica]